MPNRDDLMLRSNAFPARTLLDSYYDRDVTQLSDRGLASNMIGDRWSDVAAEVIERWAGAAIVMPDHSLVDVHRVYRLDITPQIATIASRRKLQNPDFIIAGKRDGQNVIFAVDAKFSIDTAKSAQVANETLSALLEVGAPITDWLPDLATSAAVQDGYFISPDMPLSHYVLGRSRGRLAARVSTQQTLLIPVQPVPFLKDLSGSRLLGPLATLDGFRDQLRSNMLLSMYYFRLARACYGAYAETARPIFGPALNDDDPTSSVERLTIEFAHSASSSWDVVQQWDTLAEHVRRQREAAYAAMAFPMANREFRDRIVAESLKREVVAPSINNVRKRVGAWYRGQFDQQLGTVMPPVADMPALLQQIHRIAADVMPLVEPAFDSILDETLANQPHISSAESETV